MKLLSRKSLIDALTLAGAALITASIGIGIWALPRPAFSEQENRALAPAPTLSWSALTDGRFFSSLSSFCSDSLPLRTQLIRAKAYAELSLGKRENNGVLFLDNATLADRCEYDSVELLGQNVELLQQIPFSAGFAVPRSADVYIQSEYAQAVRDAVYSKIGGASLYAELKKAADRGERVYYKTDHHLDVDGAYILYCHIVRALGETPYERSEFDVQNVSDSFLGSTYSKSGLIAPRADTLTLLRFEGDEGYEIECTDPDCDTARIYCFEFLEKKDKYSVFTGGNHPLLTIQKSGEQRKTLLLVKDSFANAVVPLLARHFDLVIYDPRYASEPPPECDMSAYIFGIDTLATTRLSIGGRY